MPSRSPPRARRWRAALLRGVGYLFFWLLLARPSGADAWTDLVVGLLATALATWASLQLLAPGPARIRYGALLRLVARFLWQSMVAGIDVARRVFDPRLPIKPGYLAYPVRIPDGPRRAAFGALTSLMPGTLPVGTASDGSLVYHCLDLDQPIASSLARDEALVAEAQGGATAGD
jgi:multicomponent Na+:H+ antiporter subunit E